MKAYEIRQEKENKNKNTLTLNRREFLKTLGGGIMITFTVGEISLLESALPAALQRGEEDFNAYLRIGQDGRVSCLSGKIEMGQGIITSLAQMLAEELDVPLDMVDMVMGDTDLCPWDMGTFGSRSTKYFGAELRKAAAEARAVLIELASEKLNLPSDRLATKEGAVFDQNNPGQKISYAELTKGKTIARQLSREVSPKPRREHTICGKPFDRRDSREKVTGEAQFAGDIRLPGMLYARILRPPAHRTVLKKVDTSEAGKIPGIQVIEEEDMVAVLHPLPDEADKALSLIKARFGSPSRELNNENIFSYLVEKAPEGEIVTQAGNLQAGKRAAGMTFNQAYFNHYVSHAPMENHTAVVSINGNKATVWASTQAPFRAKDEAAGVLGLNPDNVRVITPFVGGGFGGKTRNQQVVEAARLAKLSSRPVQVAWSREEEFFYDTFRPAAVVKISSGLDKNSKIVFWDYDLYFAGSRSSEPVYNIPHYKVLSRGSWGGRGESPHPFGVGAWRGPGSNTNVFAIESQIDIMASAAGLDPLEFRMRNLNDERMKKVLQKAAQKFGRTFAKSPSGKGYGLACTNYLGTYVATMAEVEVDEDSGKINVKRMVCAQDTGEVINPEGTRLQIEGCMIMGLGYALTEEIRFKGGDVLDKNFDTYEIPRFSWLPEIETVLVENNELPPQGCGEPAITTVGAVLANAVYDACGVRLFVLPMTKEKIKAAIKENRKAS
ncbi:MAG: molybdopterin cofactor-binding domain-containing protein [Acidobacteriota bacterium]